MTCHDFKIQIEEQYDDLALLHLDGYWRDCEVKANFLARKFATAQSENHMRDQGNLWARAISDDLASAMRLHRASRAVPFKSSFARRR